MRKWYIIIYSIACLFILLHCQSNTKINNLDSDTTKLFQIANQFYEKSNFTEAEKYFTDFLKVDSTNKEAYYRRAYCFASNKKYKEAIEDYLKCISSNYNIKASYFCLAINYEATNNDSLALHFIDKALILDPENLVFKEILTRIKNKNLKHKVSI